MSVSINGTSGLVFNDASTQNTAATGFGFKNRIINGAMMIDQRNAGASVTNTAGNVYTLDRWQANADQASKFTVQQNAGSVTPPVGFTNYLGCTSLSAYSVPSGENFVIRHKIEGFNTADLAWGTANASTVTLSFWVRSSLTGTFGGAITNSANSYSYPFSYTISAANTWEQKSVTITGATSGTWIGATNGIGLQIKFSLGAGSTFSGTAGAWASADYASATGATSVVGTNGATFYITGVQLEKGSTATSFDYRPYGTELALCQRYYEKSFNIGTAPANNLNTENKTTFVTYDSNGAGLSYMAFLVAKRTSPTMTYYSSSQTGSGADNWQFFNGSVWANGTGTTTAGSTERGNLVYFDTTLGNSAGQYCFGHWAASAEL